ncbi:hypothetical protein EsDP_00003289 [Epichloe bromicola]|uniref:Uncharacterized protein n=1 Tax=Epichloe bromicola TaxID=79588 RepID=A0ABQ0CND7_9HYPO
MSDETPSPPLPTSPSLSLTISHGSSATGDATPDTDTDTDRRARVRRALLADNAVGLSPAMSERVADDVALLEAAMALARFSREAHRCSRDEIRRISSPPSASASLGIVPGTVPETGTRTRTVVGKGGRRGAGKARPKPPSAAAAAAKKERKEKEKESVVDEGDDSRRVRGAVADENQKAASFTMVLRKNARAEKCAG